MVLIIQLIETSKFRNEYQRIASLFVSIFCVRIKKKKRKASRWYVKSKASAKKG